MKNPLDQIKLVAIGLDQMEMIEKNAAAGNTIPGKVELAL